MTRMVREGDKDKEDRRAQAKIPRMVMVGNNNMESITGIHMPP
jgi:hypothetical protein